MKPEGFFGQDLGEKSGGTHRETDTRDINMNIFEYIYICIYIISVYLCISNSYFSWILVLDIVVGILIFPYFGWDFPTCHSEFLFKQTLRHDDKVMLHVLEGLEIDELEAWLNNLRTVACGDDKSTPI